MFYGLITFSYRLQNPRFGENAKKMNPPSIVLGGCTVRSAGSKPISSISIVYIVYIVYKQWRSEGNWRPGANLNFAPPPKKKIVKNDNKMYSTTDHVYI